MGCIFRMRLTARVAAISKAREPELRSTEISFVSPVSEQLKPTDTAPATSRIFLGYFKSRSSDVEIPFAHSPTERGGANTVTACELFASAGHESANAATAAKTTDRLITLPQYTQSPIWRLTKRETRGLNFLGRREF